MGEPLDLVVEELLLAAFALRDEQAGLRSGAFAVDQVGSASSWTAGHDRWFPASPESRRQPPTPPDPVTYAAAMVLAADFSETPFWWVRSPPTHVPVELPTTTDVAIVGAGYTGLNAALQLARGGRDVTVLDAAIIGSGASSRSAGLVSGRAGISKMIDLTALVGEQQANAILDDADDAYDALRTFVADENLDCSLDHCGRFVTATTAPMLAKLEKKMHEYNAVGLDEPFELVPRDRQSEWVQSDLFLGGMAVRNAGTIDPAAYTAGLIHLCRDAGVQLVGKNAVLDVDRSTTGFAVHTEAGALTAGDVIIATNGYTGKLTPWLQRRIVPMSSTIAATEPMDPAVVSRLLPQRAAYIDGRRLITYARPSPDGTRILFGGRARFRPISLATSAEILHAQMVQVFPELADIAFTHAWNGFMAFTTDHLPKVGTLDGMHYAVGCNGGSGIVAMSWLGQLTAAKILGDDRPPLINSQLLCQLSYPGSTD